MDVNRYPLAEPRLVHHVNLSDQPIYKVVLPMTDENVGCRGWLLSNIGKMADLYNKNQWRPLSAEYPWTSRDKSGSGTLFMFYRKEDAMLFALRWL